MQPDEFNLFGLIMDPHALMGYVEQQWRKEQESKLLNLKTTITAALNKCPSQWVNGICIRLGLDTGGKKKDRVMKIAAHLKDPHNLRALLDSLPQASQDALAFVVAEGGWVKYGRLSQRFGDESGDGWWWSEGQAPTSTVGRLRGAGLLFVGKAGLGERNYKAAVVPKELRPLLAELLNIAGES